LLRKNRVRWTIVVQARADISESLALLQTAALNSAIAGVVGWVDLTSSTIRDDLDALQNAEGGNQLVGIRHGAADEADPNWLQRSDVIRGLTVVRDAGLAFDLEVTERELPAAIAVADRIPDLRLVVDHLAKPNLREGVHQDWFDRITEIAARPNVMAKISGLVTEAHWDRWTVGELQFVVDFALDIFGPARLMFGSDWPVCELAASYGAVLSSAQATIASLSQTEQTQILAENARTFYEPRILTHSN
jgi:L-fuconolactonase